MSYRKSTVTFTVFLLLGLLGAGDQVQAFNQVPNPDFESFIQCPFNLGGINGVVSNWTQPTVGTSDYFHPCGTCPPNICSTPGNYLGTQAPNSGQAYAGFFAYSPLAPFPDYREYLEVQLTSALLPGQTYQVSFFVSLGDYGRYAVSNIEAYVQAGPVGFQNIQTNLLVTPQVVNNTGVISNKLGWTLVSGTFVAAGGENHLVIGNFKTDANSTIQDLGPAQFDWAYYYVDDVNVASVGGLCEPTSDGLACTQGCALPGQQCAPKEILADSTGHFLEVTCCDCSDQGCHIDYEQATGTMFCSGGCGAAGQCRMVGKGNLDGTITYSCECFTAAQPCQFEAVCNLDCGPGSCVKRCTGPCIPQSDECLPDTIVALAPVPGGTYQATCDCTEAGADPCRPVLVNGVAQCIGQCPVGAGPCNLVTTYNADGSVSYDCSCTPPPAPCEPTPAPGLQCGGECAVQGEICVPQVITADANGNFLAIECCDCKPDPLGTGPECHVDYLPAVGIFCANPCDNPGLECTLLGKGKPDGTITYECECIDITTPHDCAFVSECNPCVGGQCTQHCKGLCPPPFDACVPKAITDDGTGLGNFTVTDCDCGEVGPDHCRPIINELTGLVECIPDCMGMPCPLQVVVNPDMTITYTCPPCGGGPGACCVTSNPGGGGSSCVQITQTQCTNVGGLWLGNVPCTPTNPCPESVLPCCIDDPCAGPVCQMLTPTACAAAGGSTLYWLLSCTPDPCVEGTGACCTKVPGLPPCQVLTARECNDIFGTYLGDNTTCNPDPCDELSAKDCGTAQCCQRPPRYTDPNYAGFTGPIAIETSQTYDPTTLFPERITIFDITNRATAPLNIAWPGVPRYSHPMWDKINLGSIFGLTLDKQGHIYVSATTSYSADDIGPGGSGAIYKINNTTALPSTFATLPNAGQVGLGNIAFDCRYNQFFVTNMEDGKIYRLSLGGVTLSTFDHATPDNGAVGFAPLGERLWGVQVYNNRVYYAVWNRHNGFGSGFNQIWSVALGCGGGGADFCGGSAQLEISVPLFTIWSSTYSNPVSDISFTTKGCMLLGERSMYSDTSLGAHDARVLEYCLVGTSWMATGHIFDIGDPISLVGGNCAGGVDYDIDGYVWSTGDALKLSSSAVYGLQSLPGTGGSTANSVLIDREGNTAFGEKSQQGDVEVPCLSCVKPPIKLAAWWPLDEQFPPIANDLTMVNDGTHTNGPIVTPGKVSRALTFDGVNDRVTVPDNNTLDFSSACTSFFNCQIPQDFSIDAWIKTCKETGIDPIVDKLGMVNYTWPPTFSSKNGYSFYLNNGVLHIELADQVIFGGGVTVFPDSSATNVADGTWHHVAVTLDRDQPTGGVFYVDGVPVSTFNPTSRMRSLSNPLQLWIGAKQVALAQFDGEIDEVQIFRRSVPAVEIQGIYAAQNAGKCKDRCAIPPKLTFAVGATTLATAMTLCNDSVSTHNYSWTMTGLPSGGACTINGPTVFTPSSGIVTIAAGTCMNIPVTITAPPGLVFGQTACYDFSATNIETGGMTTCTGQLGRSKWIIWWAGPIDIATHLNVGKSTTLTLNVTNDSEPSGTLDFMLRALPHDDSGTNPQAVVRLNGLPPGTRYIGNLTLPPGQSTTIEVDGVFMEHWTLGHHELLLEDVNPTGNEGALGGPELIFSHVIQSIYVQPGSPGVAPAPHDRVKNRYISFAPNSGSTPMNFRVSKTSSGDGPIGWVDLPNAQGNAKVVQTLPPPRVWTESVVHIGDCEITPVAMYDIESTEDGVVFSDSLAVPTAPQPQGKFWGDAVGLNNGVEWTPPNGFANVTDVVSVLAFIQGNAIRPAFQVVNLEAISSADPCLNAFVNTADVLIMVRAVSGDVYPFTTNPATCLTLCP